MFCSNNLSAPILIGNQMLSPLVFIGEGSGTSSFDLADANMEQARYIQVAYMAGDEVELDAIIATHFNRPPSPELEINHWEQIFFGGVFVLVIVGGYLMWKRK